MLTMMTIAETMTASVSAYEYNPADDEDEDSGEEHVTIHEGAESGREQETAADESVGQCVLTSVESSSQDKGSERV